MFKREVYFLTASVVEGRASDVVPARNMHVFVVLPLFQKE